MNLYVAGGIYVKNNIRKFGLVRPSGKSLPYVSDKKELRICVHHSHLYQVIESTPNEMRLELVQYGEPTKEQLEAPLIVCRGYHNADTTLCRELYEAIQNPQRFSL